MAIFTGTGGKRTGSVGGETYSVSKGQNIVRSKPVTVANPRSDAQMTQRSQFLSAVRFFQRANQRFFRFAFESKKQKESEYNAFMRLNSKLGGYITKAQGDAVGFPMVAPWIITQGSLVGVRQAVYENAETERSFCSVLLSDSYAGTLPSTIGMVSEILKSTYAEITEGDIITLLTIAATQAGSAFVTDFDAEDITNENRWRLGQFIVNSNDSRSLSTVYSDMTVAIRNGKLYLDLALGASDCVAAGAVVVSRNVAGGGLKVSSTSLVLNSVAATVYEQMRDESHRQQVLSWWGAQQAAILQGSIATPAVEPRLIRCTSVEGSTSLPYAATAQENDEVDFTLGFNKSPGSVTQAAFSYEGQEPCELTWDVDTLTLTVNPGTGSSGTQHIYCYGHEIITMTTTE